SPEGQIAPPDAAAPVETAAPTVSASAEPTVEVTATPTASASVEVDAGPPPAPVVVDMGMIDAAGAGAIAAAEAPGAVVGVGGGGRVVIQKAYGLRSKEPEERPMTADTVFDLASLTKVVATAPSIMLLVEQGKLRLDDPVARHLPSFGKNGKDRITVEQ